MRAEIRAKLHSSGRYRVAFAEAPERWHLSPEVDRTKALGWARRNKLRLLDAAKTLTLSNMMDGFFDPLGQWAKRMRDRGQLPSDKILGDYAAMLRNYLIPALGPLDPREVTAREIDDTLRELRRPNGSPLASSTRYKILHVLTVVLQDIFERGLIDRNPLAGFKPYSKAPERPRGVIPRETLARLFPASYGASIRVWGHPMWAALMTVLYESGMRPGEALGLKRGDIYEAQKAAIIRAAKKSRRYQGEMIGVERAAHLGERSLQALRVWLAQSEGEWIFSLDGKRPVTNAAVGQAFRRGLAAVGCSAHYTPYWLRHSFVTYSLSKLDPREIAEIAGHSEAVSRAVYSHPDDELILRRSAAARKKLGT